VSGEGCFFISIVKDETCKLGYCTTLRIEIAQHVKDQLLIKNILNTLKCGYINNKHSMNAILLVISKLNDIYNKIIPLFNQYKIEGIKYLDFQDFCQAAELVSRKEHLTKEGLEKIRLIKSKMNKSRSINFPIIYNT